MATTNNGQIGELRKHMFDQLERLNNPALDLDKEMKKAHAIVSVGTVIVNSVKVEIDFARVTKVNGKEKPKQLGNKK